uniref:thiamine pyrophosphate-binding protein n=1 Tax=Thiohalocapsa sp. TaxID=2497641 RepID=UPI0025D13B46
MTNQTEQLVWHKVMDKDELAEGRVKTAACGLRTLCMTRFKGQYGALDNACPHQGGPLGEGSIENGLLRCPWHGWDYDPLTGKAPGFDDGVESFPVEERDDGVYVGLPPEQSHQRTVGDVMAESLVNWGVTKVFGMVGHSNLGMADALRVQEQASHMAFYGIRHEGAASFACSAYGKLTGRPAACLSIAGPGATNLLTGLWDANVDRAPVIALTGQVETQVLGPGAFQEVDLSAAFGKVAQWSQPALPGSKHAELVNLACKSAILNRGVSHLILPDEVPKLAAADGAAAGGPAGRVTPRDIAPPASAVDDAVALLAKSRPPVLAVGHGARFSMAGVLAPAAPPHRPLLPPFKGKGPTPHSPPS